jgi:hypothetical protein
MFHNLIKKIDQLEVYASKLFNKAKQNYSIIERKDLVMVSTVHKFKHYLLGNKFVFYVDHMALVYLVNKPQVSRRVTRWLLLFLEYDFTIVYKPRKTHVNIDALPRLPDIIEPIRAPNQTQMQICFTRSMNG